MPPADNAPNFAAGQGLLPAIAQDSETGRVLMLAWMNAQAYEETLRTGRAVYYSRSRGRLWRKGEESGNVQELKGIFFDCDADTLLVKVNQVGGAACHEGYRSCFFRKIDPATGGVTVMGDRLFDPAAVKDQATMSDTNRISTGILKTWVNGELVYADGKTTGLRPGLVLRHAIPR